MAITLHGSTGNNVGASASIAWTPPASSAGKFALVFLETSEADSITTPSGWTRLDYNDDGNARWGVYYRTLASSSSVTFSGTSTNKKVVTGYVFDGVDLTTPINTGEMPAAAVYSTTGTTRAIPSGTCAGDRMVVTFIGTRGSSPPSSFTAPGGWTEGADAYNTSSGATTCAGAYRAYSAGSFGGGNWTANTSESRATVYAIPLNPAATNVDYTADPADAVGVTDAAVPALDGVRSAADAVGVTDGVALERGTVASDAVGITDAASLERGTTAADAVGVTDAAVSAQELARGPADSVGVMDSAAAVQGVARGPADPVGVTDAVSSTVEASRTAADPVGVTDSTSSTIDAVRAGADQVGVTDAVTDALDAVRAPADPVGVTDTVALERATTISDGVGVTDSVTVVLVMAREVADSIGITDQATAELTGAGTASMADNVGITDSVGVLLTTVRGPGDQVQITDAALVDVGKGTSDLAAVTDSATVVQAMARTIDDAVSVTDSVTVQLTSAGDASAADVVQVTDSAAAQAAVVREYADQVGITDAVAWTMTRVVEIDDTVGVTDQRVVLYSATKLWPLYPEAVAVNPILEARPLDATLVIRPVAPELRAPRPRG